MTTMADVLMTVLDIGLDYLAMQEDEKNNRAYAKAMGWDEDGIMVHIQNETDRRRRKREGRRF